MLKIILLIISAVVVLSTLSILFIDYIGNRFYFHKFYHNELEKYHQLLEATCGEIKENKLLFSLTDRYNNLKNMLDNVKTFDTMGKFFDELYSLTDDSTNMFYEKIKNLSSDEKEECLNCHEKYLKMFDEYKKKY